MPPRVRSSARREALVAATQTHVDRSVGTGPRTSRRSVANADLTTPSAGRADSNKPERTNNQRQNTDKRLNGTTPTDAVSQRTARERKPRTTFSPSVQGPTRAYTRRRGETAESALSSGVADADLAPDERCRRLEGRVRSHVKQLRYLQTFLDAYEAEGWRRASREKLKPSKELATARRKMAAAKRQVVTTLHEMDALRRLDPPIPYLIEIETQPAAQIDSDQPREDADADTNADRIYCSRCSSTVTAEDNDILLCDNEGCFRAFHQQCQVPFVRTQDIPQGDEPWFCPACLAIFNALKAINYACDTTHEKIEDVFPDLVQEEQSLAGEGDYSASTAEGTAEEDDENDAADSEADEDDDEDFVLDDAHLDADDIREDAQSDSGDDAGDTSEDDGVVESDVSEDELHHLHNDDVIDSNRRSMRSHGEHSSATKSYLGERVAKQTEDEGVVLGVVVEKEPDVDDAIPHWRIVYYDDTMSCLDEETVLKGIDLAVEHAKHHKEPSRNDEVDESLIVRGKRKRSRVDYRALNDLMFDGKEDSDAGGDEHVESEDEDAEPTNGDEEDDEDSEPPETTTTESAPNNAKRGRRERRAVDYRAMHEGVASF